MADSDRPKPRTLRDLHDPIVVIAFGGWSDAGNAATDTVDHLCELADATLAWEMGDEHYDLQVTRPVVVGTGAEREIVWPQVQVRVGRLRTGDDADAGTDLMLVSGLEPSLRWQMFTSQLVSAVRSTNPRLVLILGAMLSDHPHSLPIPITRSSGSEPVRERYGAREPEYEGPTGITGVVTHACERVGVPTMSLWATLPHYVANSPSPKATLALLQHIETVVDTDLDLAELEQQARRWEHEVSELVDSDEDLSDYVTSLLEDHIDDPSEGSGDQIAAEFERYLRRRNE